MNKSSKNKASKKSNAVVETEAFTAPATTETFEAPTASESFEAQNVTVEAVASESPAPVDVIAALREAMTAYSAAQERAAALRAEAETAERAAEAAVASIVALRGSEPFIFRGVKYTAIQRVLRNGKTGSYLTSPRDTGTLDLG